MSDDTRELGRRLAAGEESAYAELYDRFGPALFAAATRILGRRQDAEDAVQEVFASLVRYRNRLADVTDFAAYLFVCLRRTASRQAGRRPPAVQLSESSEAVASLQPVVDSDSPNRFTSALAALPIEQREVIALKVTSGLTFAQIGEVLGISPNTAASRYRYALDKLRGQLKDEGRHEVSP